MDTKSMILQTAIELFNQLGTAEVSTNHIAAGAKISPGNLYYHYRNKEDIISAIIDQMIGRWNGIWAELISGELVEDHFRDSLRQNFLVLWDYRFFFRELIPLLEHNPQLKQRYQIARQRRSSEFEALIRRYISAGYLLPPGGEQDLRTQVNICMLINYQWLVDVTLEGEPLTAQQIDYGVNLIMYLWKPYLSRH